MEKFFFVLIFVVILHVSRQAPVVLRCPSCALVCNNNSLNIKVIKECQSCQCEPVKEISKLVPVVLCPFRICSESCGFMGYKMDRVGCKSCECQEI